MLKRFAWITLILLLLCSSACAQAPEITADCKVTTVSAARDTAPMFDGAYKTKYTLRIRGTVEIAAEEAISGVFIQYYDKAAVCDILVQQDGEWVVAAQTEEYLTGWYPLPEGTTAFRLYNGGKEKVQIAELSVYGAGERPAHAATWHTLDKCDLMLLVAHPDDDLLWFGGLMPTYGGERQLDVQTVYLVPTTGQRRLELLDGIWHCGITAYPAFGNMRDVRGETLEEQYNRWSRSTLYGRVVRIIRQFQPEVVVTHDFKGEYGHGAHQACADAAAHAVTAAADPAVNPGSVEDYGTWQVKKLYVHLYKKNISFMDWETPLEAFGGKTGIEVATEALALHVSQVKNGWTMDDADLYDNTMFGLYYTTVGPDVAGGDFMENIP